MSPPAADPGPQGAAASAIRARHRLDRSVELHDGMNAYLAVAGHVVDPCEREFVVPSHIAAWAYDACALRRSLDRNAGLDLLRLAGEELYLPSRFGDPWLDERVRTCIERGRIVLLRLPRETRPVATRAPPLPFLSAPSPARPVRPDKIFRYPVTVIDDMGRPVDGVGLKFDLAGTPRMTVTNGAGDGTTEWVDDTQGDVRVLDLASVRKKLKPRWREARSSSLSGDLRQRVDRDAEAVSVRSGVRTTIVLARPAIVRTRLIGAFFDTSKSFLLPSAIGGIRGMRRQYEEHPLATVLVVGHTDTTGAPDYNETLSLERAEAVAAFLKNDVAVWEAWFGEDKAADKRWGPREVQLMLSVLPERADDPFWAGTASGRDDARMEKAVKGFQQFSNDTRGTSLEVDGKAGPKTRHEIVQAYMQLQGTTVPDGTEVVTHGCGENFPAEPTPDGTADPDNRRVEIFLFDGPIDPPPVGEDLETGGHGLSRVAGPPRGDNRLHRQPRR